MGMSVSMHRSLKVKCSLPGRGEGRLMYLSMKWTKYCRIKFLECLGEAVGRPDALLLRDRLSAEYLPRC